MVKMIIVDKVQTELLNKYIPNADKLLQSGNVNDLLDAIDDVIQYDGMDKNYELTHFGLELQMLYDQICNQNN